MTPTPEPISEMKKLFETLKHIFIVWQARRMTDKGKLVSWKEFLKNEQEEKETM